MSYKVLKHRPSLRDLEWFKEEQQSDLTAKVLEQEVQWRRYNDSFITDEELGLILDYDRQSAEDQADLLSEKGAEYARFFCKILEKISEEHTVQYVLVLVDQLLHEDPLRAAFFHEIATEMHSPFTPFLRILKRHVNQKYTVSKAAHVLSVLLSYRGVDPDSAEVSDFLSWLNSRLESSKGGELLHAVVCLKDMLKAPGVQVVFVEEGGLRILVPLMAKETQNTQLMYHVCFCFWLLSYNERVHPQMDEHHVVTKLVEVLKSVLREKVVRVAFATFKNLLGKQHFNEGMIAMGLSKVIANLKPRKWTDEDLVKDMALVEESLNAYIQVLSSFEKYQAEVLGGHLEWTPVHSERFWRENIRKFGEDNFNLIRCLIALLDSDDDELTLEVACYDLGEFVRFHPDGRRVIDKLGAKKKLMERMNDERPKIAKQALLAVQKLMVNNWESLSAASSGRKE